MTGSNDDNLQTDVRWIRCPGCSGEIGVPHSYPADAIACPKCAAIVSIDERIRIRWRPNIRNDASEHGSTSRDSPSYVRWIACHSCDGEIGVPESWLALSVACPKCGAIVPIKSNFHVLWRPASPAALPESQATVGASPFHQNLVASDNSHSQVRQKRQWRAHLISMLAILAALELIAIGVSYLVGAQGADILAFGLTIGAAMLLLLGIGCWLVVLVKIIAHGRPITAAVLFFLLPAALAIVEASAMRPDDKDAYRVYICAFYMLFTFVYGWGTAMRLCSQKTMLVWTYSLVAATSLATSAFTMVAVEEFRAVEELRGKLP